MNTIKQIIENHKKQDFKIYIKHFRYVKVLDVINLKINEALMPINEIKNKGLQRFILPHGGKTTIEILSPDNKVKYAEAVCGKKDSFNRRRGLAICFGRLENNPVVSVE